MIDDSTWLDALIGFGIGVAGVLTISVIWMLFGLFAELVGH